MAIVGDWNGDGRDELGVYRPGTRRFYLDFDGNGVWNSDHRCGEHGLRCGNSLPVIGDWDGNGIDDIGTYSPTTTGLPWTWTGAAARPATT